jgi:putative nucleotidyltransferase with HDIG domain
MNDLEKKIGKLKELTNVAAYINSALDHSEIRRRTIEATTNVLNVEAASLLLLDEDTGELYFDVATGEKGEEIKKVRLARGKGFAGWVAEHKKPLIIHDAPSDPRFFKTADKVSGFTTRDLICTPVELKGETIGVLQGINKKDEQFDDSDLELINSLSHYVAVAIENSRLYTELKETFYCTAEVLAEAIELRDPYTGGHTKRVKDYSEMIGRSLGFSTEQMEQLRLAAILHDIGKIGISDSILHKQAKLDDNEFEKMNKHSLYGAELLNSIKQLEKVIPGIRGHHEKFDGSGHPDGLKAEEIPVIAGIISVADTFDAMTTDRPYRKGLSKETAFNELERCAGTQFDPEVVKAFLKAYK